MHTNQLRQIMTICQEGSINRAAKVLNCSQPNLSHSLRELEKELGFTVFRRTSAGVRLTPQGETLLSHVSDILYHLDIVEQISDEGRGAPTSFHAALPSSSYCGLALSRWIPTAFQETDAAEVHLCETGTEETIERVFSGSSDLELRLLTALEVLQARREAESLMQGEREKALCANACLLARALERNEQPVFESGLAVLETLTPDRIAELARQGAALDRGENPAPEDDEERVRSLKKAWSTRRKRAFAGVCSGLLAHCRPRNARSK